MTTDTMIRPADRAQSPASTARWVKAVGYGYASTGPLVQVTDGSRSLMVDATFDQVASVEVRGKFSWASGDPVVRVQGTGVIDRLDDSVCQVATELGINVDVTVTTRAMVPIAVGGWQPAHVRAVGAAILRAAQRADLVGEGADLQQRVMRAANRGYGMPEWEGSPAAVTVEGEADRRALPRMTFVSVGPVSRPDHLLGTPVPVVEVSAREWNAIAAADSESIAVLRAAWLKSGDIPDGELEAVCRDLGFPVRSWGTDLTVALVGEWTPSTWQQATRAVFHLSPILDSGTRAEACRTRP